MDGFMDDTSIWVNTDTKDLTELETILQHDTQLWEELFFAKRGLLEVPKCSYYLMA